VSPDPNLDDLASKLERQRANAEHRRLRSIQQFSHRFRFAALLVVALFFLLSYIFYVMARQRPQSIHLTLAWATLILGWGYLLALPLLFAWRLSLPAYALRKHWMWLSLTIGLPIDVYLLPAIFHPNPAAVWTRIPLVFFSLLLWGWMRRGAREKAFREEVDRRAGLWEQLFGLGTLDIALFGFWHLRALSSEDKGSS